VGAVVTTPTDLVRIHAFLQRICKEPSRDHAWLADFQAAVLTDPDLDQALVDENTQLAKSALGAIVYRLFQTRPPPSLRSSLKMIGVAIPG
jgi:hypothetical protein